MNNASVFASPFVALAVIYEEQPVIIVCCSEALLKSSLCSPHLLPYGIPTPFAYTVTKTVIAAVNNYLMIRRTFESLF